MERRSGAVIYMSTNMYQAKHAMQIPGIITTDTTVIPCGLLKNVANKIKIKIKI